MSNFQNFIDKAKEIHSSFYNYDKVKYKNARTKVTITCPVHGDFEQLPYNHLIGKGCNKCSIDKNKKQFTKSLDKFINQANIVHKNKYDYSKVNYVNDGTKVEIICPEHGSFFQAPNDHLRGSGCVSCGIKNTIDKKIKKYSEIFPKKASVVHNNKYDYSKSKYVNSSTMVEIECPKHGIFMQMPDNHLQGRGCPKCNQSNGERKIENYLIKNNIKFTTQKKFSDCVYKDKLSFDFWLEDKNLLIEFDGMQHYKPVGYIGGLEKLEYTKICDKIKDEYCIKNNIHLLRISYKDIKNIDKILSINCHTY
jgi:hypothetical protein